MKICSRCGQEKELTAFYKAVKGYYYSYCKSCRNEYYKEWRLKNKEQSTNRTRQHNLKSKYGISLETYEDILIEQGYKCANENCLNTEQLKLDHCHQTNFVRGILCNRCNLMLGSASDDINILEGLITYLKEALVYTSRLGA